MLDGISEVYSRSSRKSISENVGEKGELVAEWLRVRSEVRIDIFELATPNS